MLFWPLFYSVFFLVGWLSKCQDNLEVTLDLKFITKSIGRCQGHRLDNPDTLGLLQLSFSGTQQCRGAHFSPTSTSTAGGAEVEAFCGGTE
jgi:hypothetical protein